MKKKYKTWEAMKMLTENQKHMFKSSNVPIYLKVNSIGLLIDEDENYVNVPLEAEWVLVAQPVDFKEAFKAYVSDKTIYCTVDGRISRYFTNAYGKYRIEQAKIEELNGNWYIEEE